MNDGHVNFKSYQIKCRTAAQFDLLVRLVCISGSNRGKTRWRLILLAPVLSVTFRLISNI